MKLIRKIRNKKKGQTALEYAMVVGAISLVILSAWNILGDQVRQSITGKLASDINDQLIKGNATIKK